MEAEQKITFDETGSNSIFFEDSTGTIREEVFGGGFWQVTNDGVGASSNFSSEWFFMGSGNEISMGSQIGVAGGRAVGGLGSGNTSRVFFVMCDAGGNESRPIEILYNGAINRTTGNLADNIPASFASRNSVINALRKNAVMIGGQGGILDTDNVAHTQAMSVKINDLGVIGSNQTLTISDGAYIRMS